MEKVLQFVANPVMFAIGYIILMTPTYILPYMGSNSLLINAAGSAASGGVYPLFLIHLGCLVGLIILAWARGKPNGKNWLIALPIAASLFDMVPGLSLIPMVPTVLHVATLILGVKEDKKLVTQ